LLMADWGADLATFQASGGQTMPSDGPEDFWAQLNGVPIGGATMELLTQSEKNFSLSKVNDSGVIDQLKLFDGQFTLNVTDERSKVNINTCYRLRSGGECRTLLKALLSCPAEHAFLEKRKVNADELIANLKNWIDDDERVDEGTGSSELDPYEQRQPKVHPKNAPFDTLEELKVVAGWEDDVYEVFSPYLTVFPYQELEGKCILGGGEKPEVNINSASRELVGCLLPQASNTHAEKSLKWFNPLEDVPKPDPANSLASVNKMGDDLFGETDKERMKNFTYLSDTYRVVVQGEVGDQTKKLETVLQRRFPNDEEKKQGINTTYKILYFKML